MLSNFVIIKPVKSCILENSSTLFNAFLNAMTEKAAEIGDPLMSPISKMEKIRVAALTIPFGLEAAYENRSWALTQKRKYLEHGGDFHIRSANVYLT